MTVSPFLVPGLSDSLQAAGYPAENFIKSNEAMFCFIWSSILIHLHYKIVHEKCTKHLFVG